jgi:hypothetical protein
LESNKLNIHKNLNSHARIKYKKNLTDQLNVCYKIVDSLIEKEDLCKKSLVPYLNAKSTQCGIELYNLLLNKCVDRYKKSNNSIDYEKLECLLKYSDGALSDYAGMVLMDLFLKKPVEITDKIFQYEIDNDTSFVRSVILIEATNSVDNNSMKKIIQQIIPISNLDKKLFLEDLLNYLK